MKTKRPNFQLRHAFWTFAAIAILSFTSCAIKAPFLNSSVVPAAEGYVKMKNLSDPLVKKALEEIKK